MKRMNELFQQSKGISLVVALFLFIASACDTTNMSSDQDLTGDLDVPAAALIEGLDLSDAEAQRVAEIMGKYDTQEPGRLWYVSAELQQTLSDDQKAELIARVDDEGVGVRSRRGGARGERGAAGKRMRPGFEGLSTPLTDDQKEQLKAASEEQREAMRALVEQRRDGSLSDEEFKTQMEAARESMRSTLEGILTEEQLSELEARREEVKENAGQRGRDGEGKRNRGRRGNGEDAGERREEFQSAMIEALDITPEQQEQMKAVREELRTQMNDLRDQFDRENPEGSKEAMQALRESVMEKHEAILTAEQREAIAIHRALMQETLSTVKGKRKQRTR